jgi:hypothetical protein
MHYRRREVELFAGFRRMGSMVPLQEGESDGEYDNVRVRLSWEYYLGHPVSGPEVI